MTPTRTPGSGRFPKAAVPAFGDDAEQSKPLRGALAIYDGPWALLARLEDSPLANPNFQIPNPKSHN